MIIKQSVTGADDRFAVAHRVPSEPEPWGHIIPITGIALGHIERLFRRGIEGRRGPELRRQLEVVAHAIVQCESRANLPAVLDEEALHCVVEQTVGVSDALDEGGRQAQTVGLHAGEAGDSHAIECTGQR